jgi:signal transduction histidine kinase
VLFRSAPEGSTITLDWRTLPDGDHLIRVRDHGPGIPADELDSIFESFVQSSRTKDGSGGTGLGLAICRKIMAAHHGTIRATNAEGGGACFEIRLPGLTLPAAALAPQPAAADDAIAP